MDAFAQFIPLILIFAIMYFLLIRPQQRKLKDHKKMVESQRLVRCIWSAQDRVILIY